MSRPTIIEQMSRPTIIERLPPTLCEVVFDLIGAFVALARTRRCSRTLHRRFSPMAATRIWLRLRPANLADALTHPLIPLRSIQELHAVYGFAHEDARAHHNLAFLVACTDGRLDLVRWLADTFRLTSRDMTYAIGHCQTTRCALHPAKKDSDRESPSGSEAPSDGVAPSDGEAPSDSKAPFDEGPASWKWEREEIHIDQCEFDAAPDLAALWSAATAAYAAYDNLIGKILYKGASDWTTESANAQRAHCALTTRLRVLRRTTSQNNSVNSARQRLECFERHEPDVALPEYTPTPRVRHMIRTSQKDGRPTEDALIAASANGHNAIVKWITKRTKPNANWGDALVAACKNGHLRTARFLYRRDSGLFDYIRYGNSNVQAFHQACRGGHSTVVKWLCRHVRCDDDDKRLGFEIAIANSDMATLAILTERFGGAPSRGEYLSAAPRRCVQYPLGPLPPEAIMRPLRGAGARSP